MMSAHASDLLRRALCTTSCMVLVMLKTSTSDLSKRYIPFEQVRIVLERLGRFVCKEASFKLMMSLT